MKADGRLQLLYVNQNGHHSHATLLLYLQRMALCFHPRFLGKHAVQVGQLVKPEAHEGADAGFQKLLRLGQPEGTDGGLQLW